MSGGIEVGARDRRTLGLGAVSISLLVGISRGVPAVRSWTADRTSQATRAAEQLTAVQIGMQSRAAIRDTLLARRQRLATADSLLPAESSPSGVAAAVASTLEDFADDNAVKLASMQLRADSTVVAGRVRVSVRIAGTTDVTGLAGLLRSIEAGATLLVVRDLSISQAEPAAPDAKPEALRFDILVAGMGRVTPRPREVRE